MRSCGKARAATSARRAQATPSDGRSRDRAMSPGMLRGDAERREPGTSMASTSASTFRGVLWRDHRRGTQVHPKTRRRGDWWISWKCRHGHQYRETIGPKSLKEEYGRRRTQVRRRFLPERASAGAPGPIRRDRRRLHPLRTSPLPSSAERLLSDRLLAGPMEGPLGRRHHAPGRGDGEARARDRARSQAHSRAPRSADSLPSRDGQLIPGGPPVLLQRGDPQWEGSHQSGGRDAVLEGEQHPAEVFIPSSGVIPPRGVGRGALPTNGDRRHPHETSLVGTDGSSVPRVRPPRVL